MVLVISTQIIREYAHVTIRHALYQKLDLPGSIHAVIQNINIFQRDFTILHDSSEVLNDWISFLPLLTTHKDVFDFNITATLKTHGIAHLLTHNFSDFDKFSSWLNVLPLFP